MADNSILLCQYTYKPCSNPRSVKKNGSLHSFCEDHRRKANAIQKAYALNKRLRESSVVVPRPLCVVPVPMTPVDGVRPILPRLATPSFDADEVRFLHDWLTQHVPEDSDDGLCETEWSTDDYGMLCDLF
ncbi:hypothetical protein SPRG_11551 [Saprolegnia parasitica CBS 223.65]|uniref:Uncharacterized protein n=1 Tax=Saprolegnia parasitica (strain CBS 223.65) TaxID=695850 RepID=A0A067C7L6_SAPPC|nr:hypothetical protein SPRG_11551 [Saprolegnia parasitica CBS 223.65]KDO22792.1 hypothetical protein SPRG_11551 [Saprolegnia parasitica CBS 223.65]|eukprot:XP_012206466.1 hypothetical protein SPRG_11551 [Saprolegnia parasitica CBS 223.65]